MHQMSIHLAIETELEADGRWLAEVPSLPGVVGAHASVLPHNRGSPPINWPLSEHTKAGIPDNSPAKSTRFLRGSWITMYVLVHLLFICLRRLSPSAGGEGCPPGRYLRRFNQGRREFSRSSSKIPNTESV